MVPHATLGHEHRDPKHSLIWADHNVCEPMLKMPYGRMSAEAESLLLDPPGTA